MIRAQPDDFQDSIGEMLDYLANSGECIVIHQNGEDVAIICFADRALLRELENRQVSDSIRRSKAEAGKTVDWEEIKRECGL